MFHCTMLCSDSCVVDNMVMGTVNQQGMVCADMDNMVYMGTVNQQGMVCADMDNMVYMGSVSVMATRHGTRRVDVMYSNNKQVRNSG